MAYPDDYRQMVRMLCEVDLSVAITHRFPLGSFDAALETARDASVAGKVIVIDPFLEKNPKTPARDQDPKALGKVDLILLTHGHGDPIGETVAPAKMTGAKGALDTTAIKVPDVAPGQAVTFRG